MNSYSITKSMNSSAYITDGEITIENGQINFNDGSSISSLGDVVLKSADNTFTGNNTFSNVVIASTAPSISTHLTNKYYVDTQLAYKSPLISPDFSGTPTAPTAVISTNSTQLATTAYVKNQLYSTLASPEFSGTPLAPTAVISTNSTQIATTAYVKNQLYSTLESPSFTGTVTVTGYTETSGGFKTTYGGGNYANGIFGGTGDGADYTTYNLKIGSWDGVGFYCTTPDPFLGCRIVMSTRYGTITSTGLITSPAVPTSSYNLTNKTYVDTALSLKANIASPSFTGNITTDRVVNLGDTNHTVGKYGSAVSNYWDTTNSKPYNGVALGGWVDGCIGTTYDGTHTTAIYWTRNVDSGCVGIYKTDPAYRLDVSGTFRCSGIARITDTTTSANTVSGALIVSGGVGITGDLNLSGNIGIGGTTGNLTVGGNLVLNSKSALNDQQLNVRSLADDHHYIKYESNAIHAGYDGVKIAGYYGGSMYSTISSVYCLKWNATNVIIPQSTTNTLDSATGALIVSGGVGVAGNLTVGGLYYGRNNFGGASITYPSTGTSFMWNITGGAAESNLVNIVPNSYYTRGFNFHNIIQGTAFTGSATPFCTLDSVESGLISRLNITNTTTGTVNTGTTPITVNTDIGNCALRIAGDCGVVGNLICKNFFQPLHTIPIFDTQWFTVNTNTSYSSGNIASYGTYNNTKYPYRIQVNFRPASASYPIYDITGQCFSYAHSDGYGIRWDDAYNFVVRTGVGSVCQYHDGSNYQNPSSGTYRILVYA